MAGRPRGPALPGDRCLFHYQARGPAADLDRKVGAAVPGIDLAHAGEVQAGQRGLDGRDVLRMVDGRNRLGIGGLPQPGLLDPAAVKGRVEALQAGQEALEELLERFLPAIQRFNPNFKRDWVRKTWLFKTNYAQPVPEVNHSKNIPAIQTPIPGLYFASMSQVYPWDRGTNFAVEIGRRAAGIMEAGNG